MVVGKLGPSRHGEIERGDASGVGHSHVPSVKRDNFNFVNKEKEKRNEQQ